jgi:hypothetical protein
VGTDFSIHAEYRYVDGLNFRLSGRDNEQQEYHAKQILHDFLLSEYVRVETAGS